MTMLVEVEWIGPFPMKALLSRALPDFQVGLYQIYGPHNCYGRDQLLYIGMSESGLRGRLLQHNWLGNERGSESSFHLGRIGRLDGKEVADATPIVHLVERLLIYAHVPAYNSQSIRDLGVNDPVRELHVLNWRNHGVLMPEVSGIRWTRAPLMEIAVGET